MSNAQGSTLYTGSCLCGRIQFRLTAEPGPIDVCYCQMCRKAQGGPLATNAPVDASAFEVTQGTELLTAYESSPGEQRLFCSRCGSPIYSKRTDRPRIVRVRVGTINEHARNAQNLNFALPAEWVRELPQRHAKVRAQAASSATAAASAPGVARVPYLDETGQARYRKYLTEPAPKAFAISDNGFFGAAASEASGRAPLTDAKERALQSCAVFAQRLCKVYAIDDAVVFRP